MNEKNKVGRRRGFLLGAGAAGAAAGVAVIAAKTAAPVQAVAEAPVAAEPAQGSGYRVTEHVKRYYRTTTV